GGKLVQASPGEQQAQEVHGECWWRKPDRVLWLQSINCEFDHHLESHGSSRAPFHFGSVFHPMDAHALYSPAASASTSKSTAKRKSLGRPGSFKRSLLSLVVFVIGFVFLCYNGLFLDFKGYLNLFGESVAPTPWVPSSIDAFKIEWPQLDARIHTAISRGELVGSCFTGKECSTKVPHKYTTTIVSAYYQFKSKHLAQEYKRWFSKFLAANDPIIVFVEPNSTWSKFVQEQRATHAAPTLLIEFEFSNLLMNTTLTDSFWQEQREIDKEKRIHKGTGVYKIWNEKVALLASAEEVNPFKTDYFAWVDAGYYMAKGFSPPSEGPSFALNLTKAGVPDTKMLLLHIRNETREHHGYRKVCTAGNMFVGHKKAVRNMYHRYYATLWDMIKRGEFVGSDQMVMCETCYRYPDVCFPYFSGSFRAWHDMASLLRNRGSALEISPHFKFSSATPVEVKELAPFPTEPIETMNISGDGWK
ncbi:hypothetical protein ACHAWF_004551, partial [Thalassiosira exigua]